MLIRGIDMWADPLEAKALVGVLGDGVQLFDRLTGEQLVTYAGLLLGLDARRRSPRARPTCSRCSTSRTRRGTLVVDYSAGMTKKIALACALVHAPRLLVLDEPFESVDPVSAANIRDILDGYVAARRHGHRVEPRHGPRAAHVRPRRRHRRRAACWRPAPIDEVRGGATLEDRFVELVGGRRRGEGPEWLRLS